MFHRSWQVSERDMAMEPEDTAPKAKAPAPIDFDRLSVAELHEYIGALQAEIARAEAAIAAKRQVRGTADALFRR